MITIRHCRDINSCPFSTYFRQFHPFPHYLSPLYENKTTTFRLVYYSRIIPVFRKLLFPSSNKNIAMSQPPTVQITGVPPVLEANHERILDLEKKARETHELWISIRQIMGSLQMQKFGKPFEVFKRIYEFVLRSSDIADCGEPCVSLGGPLIHLRLTPPQRTEDVYLRALALLEAEAAEGEDQRVRAANAVKRAREETEAEYEERKAAGKAEREKRVKEYVKERVGTR